MIQSTQGFGPIKKIRCIFHHRIMQEMHDNHLIIVVFELSYKKYYYFNAQSGTSMNTAGVPSLDRACLRVK